MVLVQFSTQDLVEAAPSLPLLSPPPLFFPSAQEPPPPTCYGQFWRHRDCERWPPLTRTVMGRGGTVVGAGAAVTAPGKGRDSVTSRLLAGERLNIHVFMQRNKLLGRKAAA